MLFWVAVACCLTAQIAIVRSVVRPRQQDGSGTLVPRTRYAVELAWTLIPAAVLVLVLVLTWQALHGAGVPVRASGAALTPVA